MTLWRCEQDNANCLKDELLARSCMFQRVVVSWSFFDVYLTAGCRAWPQLLCSCWSTCRVFDVTFNVRDPVECRSQVGLFSAD